MELLAEFQSNNAEGNEIIAMNSDEDVYVETKQYLHDDIYDFKIKFPITRPQNLVDLNHRLGTDIEFKANMVWYYYYKGDHTYIIYV